MFEFWHVVAGVAPVRLVAATPDSASVAVQVMLTVWSTVYVTASVFRVTVGGVRSMLMPV
jgi:hypothetical protein